MTSRRSFLRSLSLLPLAPGLLSEVAVEAAVAASVPERPTLYYHYEKADDKMADLMKQYEKYMMAGNPDSTLAGLTLMINK